MRTKCCYSEQKCSKRRNKDSTLWPNAYATHEFICELVIFIVPFSNSFGYCKVAPFIGCWPSGNLKSHGDTYRLLPLSPSSITFLIAAVTLHKWSVVALNVCRPPKWTLKFVCDCSRVLLGWFSALFASCDFSWQRHWSRCQYVANLVA